MDPKSQSEDEMFENAFEKIVEELTDETDHSLKVVMDWIQGALRYNVPHGKKNRGRMVVMCYKLLAKEVQAASVEKAVRLGWCIEIIQAFLLIHDDQMDNSITRRGQPCWYRRNSVGALAINDGDILHSCALQILAKHCRDTQYFGEMLDLYITGIQKTLYGQCLDVLSSKSGCRPKFEVFTRERYAAIVKHKTSYYTYDMPVRAAMYLAGIVDQSTHKEAQEILFEIGHYFQVQDDFLDCFGDPKVLGKIGTDIEEGKCTWLAVEAYTRAKDDQKAIFEENYGIDDKGCVDAIKKLYLELKLDQLYTNYEAEIYRIVQEKIANLCRNKSLNPQAFTTALDMIYKRTK